MENHELESMRKRLNNLVSKDGNFNDPHVLALSQELDEIILFIQQSQLIAKKIVNY